LFSSRSAKVVAVYAFAEWHALCSYMTDYICEARLMQAKRVHYFAAIFLLTLLPVLSGCNRHSTQSAQSGQSTDQSNANVMSPTNPQPPQNANNNAPTLANSDSAQPDDAPTNTDASNAAPQQNAATSEQNNPAPPQALVIPAGTSVVVRLQQSLSSASAAPGERFEAVLDQPLLADNQVIAPAGTPVTGHVVVARRSGRLHHPGEIGLTLDSVTLGQQKIPVATSDVVARGGSHKKRNLGWIGGGTGGGALIGALAGGGKGALIGGGIGAAAGTTTALLTGKKDVGFGVERRLTFRLHRDITVQS
jgi:hypothetical protein